jgi:putative flippase GtrA
VLAVAAGLGLDGLLRRPLPLRRLALGAGAALGAAAIYVLVVWATGDLTASSSTEASGLVSLAVSFVLSVAVVWAAGRTRPGRVVAATLLLVVLELAYLQDWNVFLPPDQATPP